MKNKRNNNFAWAKWGSIAACFALAFILSTGVIIGRNINNATNTNVAEQNMIPEEQPMIGKKSHKF